MISNAELARKAKQDLKDSLGHQDWRVLMDDEGHDIRLGRCPVVLKYHLDKGTWEAYIVGSAIFGQYGSSAPEAFTRLRQKVEFISDQLKNM